MKGKVLSILEANNPVDYRHTFQMTQEENLHKAFVPFASCSEACLFILTYQDSVRMT